MIDKLFGLVLGKGGKVIQYLAKAQEADEQLKRVPAGQTATLPVPDELCPDVKSRGGKVFDVVGVVVKRKS